MYRYALLMRSVIEFCEYTASDSSPVLPQPLGAAGPGAAGMLNIDLSQYLTWAGVKLQA